MKAIKRSYLQIIMALALAVCLLAGCAAPKSTQPAPTISAQKPSVPGTTAAENEQASPDIRSTNPDAAAKEQSAFDRLLDDTFRDEVSESLITLHYTLANPSDFGITDYPRTFEPESVEAGKQVISDVKALKEKLEAFDSRLLTDDQLLTYTILSAYLNTALSAEGFELYDQPLSSSLGVQAQLPILLSEYTFYSEQDVEDYLTLLASIDTYFSSILALEKEQAAAGLGLCDTVIDRIADSCDAYLLDADHSFLSETFEQRLGQLEELSNEKRNDYIIQNRTIMNEHFVPAYENLKQGLLELKGTGGNDKGLYYLPSGKEYYQYLVNARTGTSYSDIPSLKKAINNQVLADLTAMDTLLKKDSTLGDQMLNCQFPLTDPDAILENLKEQCAAAFPPIDDYSYTIKNVPKALEPVLSPAFYLTVPIDRPQDNSIYINLGSTDSQTSLYPTLAHEGVPGHMYQNLYFNQHNSCRLRGLLDFPSYTEGWATYAEYYSYGVNGLPEDLSSMLQHNAAFTLALYALLDINIHYEGWDIEQVSAYLNQYFQIDDANVITTIYYDVAENPANYLEYYVGYLEILNMKQEAMNALDSRFSELEFHRFLLDIGPAPFGVIRTYFNEWLIKSAKN